MSKIPKSVHLVSSNLTKEQKRERDEIESLLKGELDKLKAPSHFTKDQKSIFNKIIKGLEPTGILSKLDTFILEETVLAIDRLQKIEMMINQDEELILDRTLMAAKEKYSKVFFRGIQELSLSPCARAKMGTLSLSQKKNETDPLLKILGGDA